MAADPINNLVGRCCLLLVALDSSSPLFEATFDTEQARRCIYHWLTHLLQLLVRDGHDEMGAVCVALRADMQRAQVSGPAPVLQYTAGQLLYPSFLMDFWAKELAAAVQNVDIVSAPMCECIAQALHSVPKDDAVVALQGHKGSKLTTPAAIHAVGALGCEALRTWQTKINADKSKYVADQALNQANANAGLPLGASSTQGAASPLSSASAPSASVSSPVAPSPAASASGSSVRSPPPPMPVRSGLTVEEVDDARLQMQFLHSFFTTA